MFICPMHPTVRQEGPGRCPQCRMALVPEKEAEAQAPASLESYRPLFVIIGLIFLASVALGWRDWGLGDFSLPGLITYFMTGFFLVFAGFKLLDLKGFAKGYSTYDILAQRVYGYGYFYPFIELGFGLAMLAGLDSPGLLWSEVAVMGFSGLGVVIKLSKGQKVQCACLGTMLKVPLTKITLVEDFGMMALALLLLWI